MKRIFCFMIPLAVSIQFNPAFSQDQTESNLCVGHYYTEDAAREVIQQLKSEYTTK